MKHTVILFYKFIKVENPKKLMREQRELCETLDLTGRIFIAKEGINATLEGMNENIERYKKALKKDGRFSDVAVKESEGTGYAFPKLRITVRDEIVTLKAKIHGNTKTAKTITADELEKMYEANKDFVIIDLRNNYEISSGAFERTVHPNISLFRELPEKLPKLKKYKNKKVITVCTGGIRCEKATKLMKKKGFSNLYQLKDGIHTYMRKYPGSHYKGTLFVFDNRMVSDITDIADKEIIGTCVYCKKLTEKYYCDDSVRPSKKLLCCMVCFDRQKEVLRDPVMTS